jgi:hypothetical protein
LLLVSVVVAAATGNDDYEEEYSTTDNNLCACLYAGVSELLHIFTGSMQSCVTLNPSVCCVVLSNNEMRWNGAVYAKAHTCQKPEESVGLISRLFISVALHN